jgi:hypothetical protein
VDRVGKEAFLNIEERIGVLLEKGSLSDVLETCRNYLVFN